ncbi:MAG: hypothetical protein HY064_04835 [Bacteroidetes bacterium]|nr:hypothetical protein [Bacteroidota bacterium]
MTRHYDLQPLEDDYRKLTALNEKESAARMHNVLESVRYELRMGAEIIFEYRDGMETPMIMRIIKNEKDLDRWIETRFARLAEFI